MVAQGPPTFACTAFVEVSAGEGGGGEGLWGRERDVSRERGILFGGFLFYLFFYFFSSDLDGLRAAEARKLVKERAGAKLNTKMAGCWSEN